MSRPDPRATMAALPKLLQPFLTWLTGVPLDDEQPLFRWRPATRLASALAVLAAGVGLGLLAVSRGGWMLAALPLAWLLTTHAMRYLNIVVMHFSSHLSFARTEAGNRRVGDAISLLLGLTPWALYRRDHAINHHSKRLATPEDPDVQALAALGFGPGRSRAGSWRLLWRTLGSPMFYLRRVAARLRLNLCTGPWWRRALFVVTQAGLWGAPLALGHGLAWAVAWGVPLLVLYHASDLLQLLSEHLWLRGRGHYLQLTEGRFLGDPWPASGSLTARARWWLRLLAVHLPVRLFVLVGDLPQHDLHHRKPRGEWANATFTRRDAARAAAGSRHPYTDRWGTLAQHIDRVFTLWADSEGPPDGAETGPRRDLADRVAPLVAVVLWGAAFVAIDIAVQELSPLVVALGRFGVASAVLGLAIGVGRLRLPSLRLRDWPALVLAAAVGLAGYQVALSYGQQGVSPTAASAIGQLAPAATWALGLVLGVARFGWRRLAGVAGVTAGAVLVVAGSGGALGVAGLDHLAATALAPVALATHTLLVGPLARRYGALPITAMAVFLATALLGLMGGGLAAAELADASAGPLAALAFLGVASTAGGYAAWAQASATRSPSRLAAWLGAIPIVTVLVEAGLGSGWPSLVSLGGVALVVAASRLTRQA